MNDQHTPTNWRLLADRFIWTDENALSLIPKEISDEEIQEYLYVYQSSLDHFLPRLLYCFHWNIL
jgi:hypothetical protein